MSRHCHKHAKKSIKSVYQHLEKHLKNVLWAGLLASVSVSSFAEGDRTDYDLDDDGLIEINDLNDLDQIRHELDGYALYGSSEGCPEPVDPELPSGCFGFELTADLDFDTNQDGKLDHNDLFWNDGKGWIPLSDTFRTFKAVFDGNGHALKNLYIYNGLDNGYSLSHDNSYIGLFGYVRNGEIRNLALTGPLSHVHNPYFAAGALAGGSWGATFKNIFSTVPVTAGPAYGLVPQSSESTFENIFVSGYLISQYSTYGISSTNGTRASTVKNALVVTSFVNNSSGDPLGGNHSIKENSYWSSELTRFLGSPYSLEQLTCENSTDDNSCSAQQVYIDWPIDDSQNVYWDMGTANQLPALVMFGKTYRDSDGDGRIDSEDDAPFNHAIHVDGDSDGAVDVWNPTCDESCRAATGLKTDFLPSVAAAYLDADMDGLPEAWAEACDLSCQEASGLTLDEHPLDRNNDGQLDAVDDDDNGDGLIDADANSNGLLDIHSLAQLNSIRYQLDGQGLRLSPSSSLDTSGCPIKIINGRYQQSCHGFELKTDLDFDTNADGVINESDEFWNDGKGWLPLGYVNDHYKRSMFDLVFQGNRKTIKNLYINRPTKGYIGLFSHVSGGQITQLNLQGHLTSVTGGRYTGLMVGKMFNGNIGHLVARGSVVSRPHTIAGGLVGGATGLRIRSVSVDGDVSGEDSVGGLVGYSFGLGNELSESHFKGRVSGVRGVGGLIGNGNSLIDFCTSDAWVFGKESVGGLMGSATGSNSPEVNGTYITNSVVRGTVAGNKRLGGIIGENFLDSILDGVVSLVSVDVVRDFSDEEWGSQIGGAIGFNHSGKISNIYILGRVTGRHQVGGLVGLTVHRDNEIRNTLTLAKVTLLEGANTTSGGIMGSPDFQGTLESNYWSTDSTGLEHSGLNADTYGNEYGLTLAKLSCPKEADNTTCAEITLFENWEDDVNQNRHWEFGTNQQLPLLALGVTDYIDSDLDGHFDHEDDFPHDQARFRDTDNDGYDDDWPTFCDETCRKNSGRRIDRFPDHPEASLDEDRDWRPDTFHDSCNTQCQLDSGLALDEYLNDADNDGVVDSEDPNIGEDDGAPIVNVSSEHFNISVDNEQGTEGKFIFDQAFMDRFSIQDAVDPNPTFYLIGVKGEADPRFIEVKLNEHAVLPAGRQELVWGVEDESGNRSEIVSTFVNVYPRLQFKQPEQTTAERADATIDVIPTADMPVLQATVLLKIDTENTTLLQSDLNEFGFPMDGSELLPVQVKQVSNSEGELSWIGQLEVPLVQDGTGEPEKQLVVTLDSIADGSAGKGIIEFNPDATTHTLTVNDSNLPPEVSLTITQGGQPVSEVKRDKGMVTVTATAVDPDVGDQIANVKWESNDAALVYWLEQVMTWEFDPATKDGGEYWIRFTAIDDQEIPQSGIIEFQFTIDPKPNQRQSGSSSSSGGGASVLLFALTLILIARRNSIRKSC